MIFEYDVLVTGFDMNFEWSAGQESHHREILEFVRDSRIDSEIIALDAEQSFNAEGWRKCCSRGIPGTIVPRVYGGGEYDLLTTIRGLEAFGYACRDNGLVFGLNAQMWACQTPLLHFGTDSQKAEYLPGLCSGEFIGAHAASEAAAGSDIYALTTRALNDGADYILNGRKIFVTNGPVATIFLVFARTGSGSGADGISCFLVDRETEGLRVIKNSKMGVRTAQMGELILEDCRVPANRLLGAQGAGMALFNHIMEWERAFILAPAIGTIRRIMEQCIAFARKRKQGGQAIGKYQMIAEKIVDMQLRLEQARGLLYRAAWSKQQGEMIFMQAAMVKCVVSEAYVQTCLDALQIFGGRGYLQETEIERELRDALASRLYSGTTEIQKNLIASLLGL